MEQTLNLTINRLPALTWHHLGMNQTSLEQVLAEGEGTLTIETPDGVTQPAQDDLPAIGGGMGPDMDTLVQAAGVPVHHFNVSAGTAASQPVRVKLTYGPEDKKINAFTIHAEAVFYLMSRGMSEEDARAMIVSGFADNVSKELPLEYAVEMNNLIRLEMKGSIG